MVFALMGPVYAWIRKRIETEWLLNPYSWEPG